MFRHNTLIQKSYLLSFLGTRNLIFSSLNTVLGVAATLGAHIITGFPLLKAKYLRKVFFFLPLIYTYTL